MSCFVVDNKTIDRILFTVLSGGPNKAKPETVMTELLAAASISLSKNWDRLDREKERASLMLLGNAMLEMNQRAFRARYEGRHAEDAEVEPYMYRPGLCTHIQGYQSLRCLLYQCSEGEVHLEPLFKALESLSDCWAHGIVQSSKEYETLPWG